ncbi:MAG: homoserine dehydrogenase [Rhodobiaceae bacterium]|nr:homoserine dehydrogenase [Rhodobiaceae bacterium]
MVDIRVGIIGLGSVGQGVVKILNDNISLIKKKTNAKISIIGVSAKNKNKQREVQIDTYQWYDNPISLAVNEDADIIIELIGGEDGVALDVVENAIRAGKDVITANKALIAKKGNYLLELAEKNGGKLLFEAAIAGSIPIVKTLKESVASNTISAIYGILNGTCNYILTSMEKDGMSFDNALKRAQDLGFAEADPTFDIEGYDAAHKLSILSSMCFGNEIDFDHVKIQGIKAIELDDIRAASDYGYAIRLLGIAKKNKDGRISQVVRPSLLSKESDLAGIEWEKNAVSIKGNYFNELLLSGPGAGRYPTASAIMGDLFDIINSTNYPSLGIPLKSLSKSSNEMTAESGRFYLRLLLPDISGTMASITNAMAKNGISIDDITQRISKKMKDRNLVPITIITSTTDFMSINKAVEDINKNNYSPTTPNIITIED